MAGNSVVLNHTIWGKALNVHASALTLYSHQNNPESPKHVRHMATVVGASAFDSCPPATTANVAMVYISDKSSICLRFYLCDCCLGGGRPAAACLSQPKVLKRQVHVEPN